MITRSLRIHALVGAFLVAAMLAVDCAPLAAADASQSAPAAADRPGTSLAEKIACVYLLVGGSIMLYYGPREKENGVVTRDGKSEAIGGAGAIVISVALLRDIVKKHRR